MTSSFFHNIVISDPSNAKHLIKAIELIASKFESDHCPSSAHNFSSFENARNVEEEIFSSFENARNGERR